MAEAAASGLPDGWVEVTDDSGRVVFYGNVKTGERQSERPGSRRVPRALSAVKERRP